MYMHACICTYAYAYVNMHTLFICYKELAYMIMEAHESKTRSIDQAGNPGKPIVQRSPKAI